MPTIRPKGILWNVARICVATAAAGLICAAPSLADVMMDPRLRGDDTVVEATR